MKSPILGSAYVARSINAANDRMVNLFPELVPEGGSEPAFLNRAPGLDLFATVGDGPIRGLYVLGSNAYVASGNKFYQVQSNGIVNLLGYINASNLPISMADNGVQIFIACGETGYIYSSDTNVFAKITDPDFPGAATVGYLDGFFVFNEPNSQKIWTTTLPIDGVIIDPDNFISGLSFASAEGSPDNVVGLIVDHREAWVFGENTVEVWYDAGNSNFPLERISGAYNEIGCASAYSIAKLDNGVFWLGKNARGQGIVYRANGYTGQRISTHAVEWQIQQYGDLSKAIGYGYYQDGHSFYVLTIPGSNTTWVYDVSTAAWHERASLVNGQFTRHRSNCQMFFQNKVIVGDYENGNLYSFNLNKFSDNGNVQKWLRSWRALPMGSNDLKRTAHHSLQLDCESGVGLESGQGSNPQVMLRWSDDSGHTWSDEHWNSMGTLGNFGTRVIWRRLGMTTKLRDRVYEVSGSDPVKIIIKGAELGISSTNA